MVKIGRLAALDDSQQPQDGPQPTGFQADLCRDRLAFGDLEVVSPARRQVEREYLPACDGVIALRGFVDRQVKGVASPRVAPPEAVGQALSSLGQGRQPCHGFAVDDCFCQRLHRFQDLDHLQRWPVLQNPVHHVAQLGCFGLRRGDLARRRKQQRPVVQHQGMPGRQFVGPRIGAHGQVIHAPQPCAIAQVEEVLCRQKPVVGLLADLLEGGHGAGGRAALQEHISH